MLTRSVSFQIFSSWLDKQILGASVIPLKDQVHKKYFLKVAVCFGFMNRKIWVILNNFQCEILASHPINGMADSN